jgi:hypothetical protein
LTFGSSDDDDDDDETKVNMKPFIEAINDFVQLLVDVVNMFLISDHASYWICQVYQSIL